MNSLPKPEVTIVIVPRERFSLTPSCVETIYQHTKEPFQLIVIDANSPEPVAGDLRRWEASHSNCRVIRGDKFLYPYEARNLVLEHLTTDWIAFVDSDIVVGPSWMTHFLTTARETGVRVVHPLYLVEQGGKVVIHMTDGKLKRIQQNGRERFHLVMGHVTQEVKEAQGLKRQESDFLEFHTFLIHRDLLQKMGPFEPFTLAEDVHYSLKLRELNEKIIFEPKAVVTYIAGPPFEQYDLPYFRFRWDLKRGKVSVDRLRERWPLTDAYCDAKISWVEYHLSRVSPSFSLRRQLRNWMDKVSR